MSDTVEEGPLEVFINLEFEKAGAKLSNDDVCLHLFEFSDGRSSI
jgi:hypothetical protein